MKNHKRYFTSIAALAILATACEDGEGMTEADVEVPEGYELSAGTATNFLTSTFAYDTDADWLSGEYQKRFTRGDRLYDDALTSSNGYGGGLGPVYAGYSCGSCHHNAGRTKPAVWTQNSKGEYGSGDYGFSAMLVYVTRRNGAFFQDYGRVLHDGRARNLTEAILWHGGEGEASKNIFINMSKDERSALIKFLESL